MLRTHQNIKSTRYFYFMHLTGNELLGVTFLHWHCDLRSLFQTLPIITFVLNWRYNANIRSFLFLFCFRAQTHNITAIGFIAICLLYVFLWACHKEQWQFCTLSGFPGNRLSTGWAQVEHNLRKPPICRFGPVHANFCIHVLLTKNLRNSEIPRLIYL